MGKDTKFTKDKRGSKKGAPSQKTNRKGYDSEERRNASKSDAHAANDISWYVPDAQILSDAASLPFSQTLDSGLRVSARRSLEDQIHEMELETPGLCVLKLAPSTGRLYYSGITTTYNAATDPINVASKAIYSFVRHANSGSANYQSADLMQYIMAMDSIYMFWSYLVRLYGVSRTYNFYNKYTPNALLRGMGIKNPEALAGSLSDLRSLINTLAIRMSSFAVPTTMPYFKRHLWLYQSVFADSLSAKAQLFMFVPSVLYQYNETGGTLDPVVMPDFDGSTGPEIIKQLRLFMESLFTPIITSESVGIMSGDILKAYGSEHIYGFATIDEGYTVIPQYSPEILPQIHNATALGFTPSAFGPIGQDHDTGYMLQTVTPQGSCLPYSMVLNVPAGATDPSSVMYATRLSCLTPGVDLPYYTGSEVVTSVEIYADARDLDNVSKYIETMTYATDAESNMRLKLIQSELFSKFTWAPQITYFMLGDTISDVTPMNWTNYDTFTTLDSETLRKIHDCALSGEFGIPVSLTKV